MSDTFWAELTHLVNEHRYLEGLERTSERIRRTGEVFTPTPLVVEILKAILPERFEPGKSVLDPACGDGQFLVAAKWFKVLHYGMTEEEALRDLFGVDIMRDNVDICRRRLGGGTIVMGDTLDPYRRLLGQTQEEFDVMRSLFGRHELAVPLELGLPGEPADQEQRLQSKEVA